MPALCRNRLTLLIVITSLMAITACSTAARKEYRRIHTLPDGARFMLVKPLPIQTRKASVYIQDGTIKTYPRVDLYAPYCQVNLSKLAKQTISLQPDSFVVSKFYLYQRDITYDIIEFESLMNLRSQANPTVKYMSCKYQGDPVDGNLKITDIEKTLAGYFKLERSDIPQDKNTNRDNANPVHNKVGETYKSN